MNKDHEHDGPEPSEGVTRRQAIVDVILALALTLAAGLFAALAARLLASVFGFPVLAVLAIQGVIILAGLAGLLAWRNQRFSDMGLATLRGGDFGLALGALLLIFMVNATITVLAGWMLDPGVVQGHQDRLATIASVFTADLSLLAVALVMLFTGFYEELLARGFLLTRCRTLFAGTWPPVLISSVLFGLGHVYQGWFGVVQTTLVGVVFAYLVLRWGRLWPVILAHGALNTVSLAFLRAMAG